MAVDANGWAGDRLFQAARFVTEMEYQHIVFEEFARKVQPAVRPFHVYNPDQNPAIPAEFAHAVYRFGHSMLDDDVARKTVDPNGTVHDNSVPLLTAFLNPPEYFQQQATERAVHAGAGRRRGRHGLLATRSATSSTSSSSRPCATTCWACRSTCRRSTWPAPVRRASRR